MFPSTILISSSSLALDQKIKSICQKLNNPLDINNPDIFKIGDANNWTITDIRHIKNFFSQKPFSRPNKIAIIFQADHLGIPAQNALLKTLEEPGKNNFIILTTSKPNALLSTILSRCQSIHLPGQPDKNQTSVIPITIDPIKNLTTADKLSADKDAILPLIIQELSIQQKLLTKQASKDTVTKIEKLIHVTRLINHNVDPRSALDYYMLSS